MPPIPPPGRERWRTPPADGGFTRITIPLMVIAAAFATYGIPAGRALAASPALAGTWALATTACLVLAGILRTRHRLPAVVLLALGVGTFFILGTVLLLLASPQGMEPEPAMTMTPHGTGVTTPANHR